MVGAAGMPSAHLLSVSLAEIKKKSAIESILGEREKPQWIAHSKK